MQRRDFLLWTLQNQREKGNIQVSTNVGGGDYYIALRAPHKDMIFKDESIIKLVAWKR